MLSRKESVCEECKQTFIHKPYIRRRFCSLACRDKKRCDISINFWKRVEKTDGCWHWKGKFFPNGYGLLKSNMRIHLAHRVSWEMAYGPFSKDLHVCHRCDTKRCVRPDHLFLGTQKDNIQDAIAKGIFPVGEASAKSKLKSADILEIRRRYALGGIRMQDLAQEFHVTGSTIRRAIRKINWASI